MARMCKAAKAAKRPRAVVSEALGHEERHIIASLVARRAATWASG